VQKIKAERKLAGRKIFLSASVPLDGRESKYKLIPDANIRIEEAILRVSSAIFNAGGTLIFGGHPSISPLIGYLCSQYQKPIDAEKAGNSATGTRVDNETLDSNPRVELWQSEAFRESWTGPSERLSKSIGVKTIWTPAINQENYQGGKQDGSQCLESLEALRHEMIDSEGLVAMIAIGGMEGVEREFEIFQRRWPRKTVYVLPTTGGAASIIYENKQSSTIKSFDDEVSRHVINFLEKIKQSNSFLIAKELKNRTVDAYIPYANIASRIVLDIVKDLDGNKLRN
jgi:hypothetical protein